MYPRYRGKVLCFLYIPSLLGDYPLFTLGPDFKVSCLELFLVNLAMHIVHQSHMSELLNKAVYAIQIAQNVAFLLTVFVNNGLIGRDPRSHSIEYLSRIARQNKLSAICEKCQIVRPENTKKVVHCSQCKACVSEHDHHCPWCSKCIAGNNLPFFYAFISLTALVLMTFWLSAVVLMTTSEGHK